MDEDIAPGVCYWPKKMRLYLLNGDDHGGAEEWWALFDRVKLTDEELELPADELDAVTAEVGRQRYRYYDGDDSGTSSVDSEEEPDESDDDGDDGSNGSDGDTSQGPGSNHDSDDADENAYLATEQIWVRARAAERTRAEEGRRYRMWF